MISKQYSSLVRTFIVIKLSREYFEDKSRGFGYRKVKNCIIRSNAVMNVSMARDLFEHCKSSYTRYQCKRRERTKKKKNLVKIVHEVLLIFCFGSKESAGS